MSERRSDRVVETEPGPRGAMTDARREWIQTYLDRGDRDGLIEMLAVELRNTEMARQRERDPGGIASADTPRGVAADVLDSDWLAAVLSVTFGTGVDALRAPTRGHIVTTTFAAAWHAVRRTKPPRSDT